MAPLQQQMILTTDSRPIRALWRSEARRIWMSMNHGIIMETTPSVDTLGPEVDVDDPTCTGTRPATRVLPALSRVRHRTSTVPDRRWVMLSLPLPTLPAPAVEPLPSHRITLRLSAPTPTTAAPVQASIRPIICNTVWQSRPPTLGPHEPPHQARYPGARPAICSVTEACMSGMVEIKVKKV